MWYRSGRPMLGFAGSVPLTVSSLFPRDMVVAIMERSIAMTAMGIMIARVGRDPYAVHCRPVLRVRISVLCCRRSPLADKK